MIAIFRFLCSSVLLAAGHVAIAAGSVVASIPGGAVITTNDLMAEVHRLPPQAQEQVLARPEQTAQFAQNMLIRRELARQAEAQGLQNDPKVEAALRVARDRVLAEAALDRADGEAPDKATLEKLARNQYDANPQKFETPEQIRVGHVLISSKTPDAETKAREVLAKARQPGADFAALAKEYSEDPGSASRGGDLGFFARGRMVPAFEAAAFALKNPGDLSDVVKTDFGYHVIRLEERKPGERRSFDEVKDQLMKSIAQSEARARRQAAVDKIAAGIELNREAIDAVVSGGGSGGKPN